jgi:hypothetical protein
MLNIARTAFSRIQSSRDTARAFAFRPRLEVLEDRTTPTTTYLVTGAGAGGGPHVFVYTPAGAQVSNFFAFDPGFVGGARVAVADVNGDGVDDIIVGAGPGGGPHVKVIDGTKLNIVDPNFEISDAALLASFFAYSPSFTGGVYVAGGDVNGDKKAEVITGAGTGGGPEVKVIDATKLGLIDAQNEITGAALLQDFFAYSPQFVGGVSVAAGDINGDGRADVITGAGPGGGPHVEVFDAANSNQLLRSFFAFSSSYLGGVFVAAGDTNGDGKDELFVGQAFTHCSPAHVRKFDGATNGLLADFVPDDFANSARVASLDVNNDGKADIVTVNGPGLDSIVNLFDGPTINFIDKFLAYSPDFLGGTFVG